MASRPGGLRRGFPLSKNKASFRRTEDSGWAMLFRFGLELLVWLGILLAVLGRKRPTMLVGGLLTCGLGIVFAVVGARRMTTWRILIDREKKVFRVLVNGREQPAAAVALEVVVRPIFGPSLYLSLQNGPGIFLAAARDRGTIEDLREELRAMLASAAQ